MYTIIHVDQNWIVCEGETGIIKFDGKAAALKTVHDANELLHSNEVQSANNSAQALLRIQPLRQTTPYRYR